MLHVLRTVFISLTFMLLAGSVLTTKFLIPVYQSHRTADVSSITAALSAASEQLTAIAVMSPAISNYKAISSGQLLSLQWLNFNPIQSNGVELGIAIIYFGLTILVAYRSMAFKSNLAKVALTLVTPAIIYAYWSVSIQKSFEITVAPRELYSILQLPLASPALASIICSWGLLFAITMVTTLFLQRNK